MHERFGRPGIVGIITAAVTLVVLAFVALGLFTSVPGLLIACTIAVVAGIGVSTVAEPGQSGRNAAVIVGYVAILILAYALGAQVAARHARPGALGGVGVMPMR